MHELFHIRVELKGVKPKIWRKICVPNWITLKQLHNVLQIAVGWSDYHLYEFEIYGNRFGEPDPDFDFGEPITSANIARLSSCLMGKKSFSYIYDFGDHWVHSLKVTSVSALPEVTFTPICLDGAQACPPEDVGGVGGYENMLEILADPKHSEFDSMMQWVGDGFDSQAFNLARVNMALSTIKLKRPSDKTLAAAHKKIERLFY
jgi:Plasmid pRiA4b ORF-3-like protein